MAGMRPGNSFQGVETFGPCRGPVSPRGRRPGGRQTNPRTRGQRPHHQMTTTESPPKPLPAPDKIELPAAPIRLEKIIFDERGATFVLHTGHEVQTVDWDYEQIHSEQ